MKLWYSYLKELKLASKGFYFYIEIIMTVIILVLLLFVIPENMSVTEKEYISLNLPEPAKTIYADKILQEDLDCKAEDVELELTKDVTVQAKLYEMEGKELYLFQKDEDMAALTKKNRPLIGAAVSWDTKNDAVKYDYYLQGYESERLKNLYRIIHAKDLEKLLEIADNLEVKKLKTGYEQLNVKQMAVPSLITFNGSLMGLFIIAAYIFLDKQEGVIKAYAVTASKVWQYLMSKALTLITVSVITTFVIVIPVMGTQPNYLMMLLLLLTSGFFSSALGLVIASFFHNMTQAFGAIYGIMMLFMLPAIAYFIPAWKPFWIQIIPIYHLIMGFKETIVVGGDMGYVWSVTGGFLTAGILLFLYANKRFKGNLTV
jgi:ABC-2 type transport system permease protein